MILVKEFPKGSCVVPRPPSFLQFGDPQNYLKIPLSVSFTMVESPTFGERTMEHPESHGSSMWSPFYDYKMHISIPSDPPVGQVTSTLETGVPLPSEDERNEALFAVFSVLGSVRKWVFPVFCCNIEREYMYLCTYVSIFLSLSLYTIYIYTHMYIL